MIFFVKLYYPYAARTVRGCLDPGGEEGGGGAECAADYNSKTIYGVEMKFGKVVENQKLINSGVI